ncbi:MAG: hypothetical protein GY782_00195 [Gammaproteobacteria bacterium]|nr:hypothetical protein [Gammaproteobacteria bacterium]
MKFRELMKSLVPWPFRQTGRLKICAYCGLRASAFGFPWPAAMGYDFMTFCPSTKYYPAFTHRRPTLHPPSSRITPLVSSCISPHRRPAAPTPVVPRLVRGIQRILTVKFQSFQLNFIPLLDPAIKSRDDGGGCCGTTRFGRREITKFGHHGTAGVVTFMQQRRSSRGTTMNTIFLARLPFLRFIHCHTKNV